MDSAPEHCRHTKQGEHLPKFKYNKNSREHYLNKVYKNICYTCGVFTLKLELRVVFVSVSQNKTAAPNANQSHVDEERKQTDGGRMCVSKGPQHHSSLHKRTPDVRHTVTEAIVKGICASQFRAYQAQILFRIPTHGTGAFSVWSCSRSTRCIHSRRALLPALVCFLSFIFLFFFFIARLCLRAREV